MRYFISKEKKAVSKNIKKWLKYEDIFININSFKFFKDQIKFSGEVLKSKLLSYKENGIKVYGFGATSKSTTIMNYFGIDNNLIEKIYDNSPTKIGCITPITNIPIVSDSQWDSDKPEVVFLFAWNHRKEIEKKYNFSNSVKVLTHLRGDIESTI